MTTKELLEYVDYDLEGFYAGQIEAFENTDYASLFRRILDKYRDAPEQTKFNIRIAHLKYVILKKPFPEQIFESAPEPDTSKPKRLKDVIL